MSARHTLSIPDDVRTVLRESTISTDRVVLPARQLERKLYAGVIKVLAEYGGKWSRAAGAILIKASDRERLEAELASGTVTRTKVVRQAFYTPPAVALRLARFAAERVAPDDLKLLEPSAGDGALIKAARVMFGNRLQMIHAVELDETEAGKIQHASIVTTGDFLQLSPAQAGRFDLILQNGPFQRGQAYNHFAHALRFLAPGGVLAAITPRNFEPPAEVEIDLDFDDIEAGAFKESGTNIATMMVRYVRGTR